MRDEIQAGLKNALERGSSLEEAVRTFVAAGYNPVEVRAAANNLSDGATSIIPQKKESPQQLSQPEIPKTSAPSQTSSSQQLSQQPSQEPLTPKSNDPSSFLSSSYAQPTSSVIQVNTKQSTPSFPIQPPSLYNNPQSSPTFQVNLPNGQNQPPHSKKTKIIILVVILILLIGVLGVMLYLFGPDLLAYLKKSS